ncbi:MAG: hypothetical protein V3S09_04190 [Candidatus Bathyarchaeia archaeon]
MATSGDRIEDINVGLPVSGADTVVDAKGLVVSPGFKADVTVFDPLNVRERATYFDPKQLPELIEYVLVNGVVTIEHGVHTGALAGKPLRHKSAKD